MQTVLSKNSCIGQLHACKLLCMKYFNFGITQVLIYTWINLNNVEIRETVWKKPFIRILQKAVSHLTLSSIC